MKKVIFICFILALVVSCATTLAPEDLKKVQSRSFTQDCTSVKKATVSRFIENGYQIDKNDEKLGYISATKDIASVGWANALAGYSGGKFQVNLMFEESANSGCNTKMILTSLQEFKDGFSKNTRGGVIKEAKQYNKIYSEIAARL